MKKTEFEKAKKPKNFIKKTKTYTANSIHIRRIIGS